MTNIETVLEILKNEVDGDISAALQKMTVDYSMTWMYQGSKALFPTTGKNVEADMKEAYPIKGRKYEIKNIAEGQDVVMVELIESYPDPSTKEMHVTPLVLVLEMQDHKIKTGRHYCDPRLSFEKIDPSTLEQAYKDTQTKKVIE